MLTQHAQQGGDATGAADRHDPARSADGQTALQVANLSGEPSLDRAREAFERADLGGRRGGLQRQKSSKAGGNAGLMLLYGVGIGAALMYLLDPTQGGRRRAFLREKLTGATTSAGDLLGRTTRDLRTRARGVTHTAGSALTGGVNAGEPQGEES